MDRNETKEERREIIDSSFSFFIMKSTNKWMNMIIFHSSTKGFLGIKAVTQTTNSREFHSILLWRASGTKEIKSLPNFDVLSHDLIQFTHNRSKSLRIMKFVQAVRFQYHISNFFPFVRLSTKEGKIN
jgi:hypothetical protein